MEVLKNVAIVIIGALVFLPTLAIFNESDTLTPNFCGFLYVGILVIASKTKVGKIALYKLYSAFEELNRYIYGNKSM